MNPTTFAEHKRSLLSELKRRRQLALDIQKAHSIDTSSIVQKIDSHAAALGSRRFTVVLFGAFSDGKTSVVSALTDRLGLEIGPAPTTDRLKTYHHGDVVLVDVPGLFSGDERHDQVTRGYVSEASLLLCVVEAMNPLKTSHHEAVHWLLVDLKKATSSIFIVNKMDEVVDDLEDTDEFERMTATKTGVIRDELKRIGIENVDSLPVVCVAADPDRKGLEYWRKDEARYERLSRIRSLRSVVDKRLHKERDELEVTAGIAGIREATLLLGKVLSDLKDCLVDENEILASQHAELRKRLDRLEREMTRAQRLIREESLALQTQLIQTLDGAKDARALAKAVHSRIGDHGELLAEKLALMVQKHIEIIVPAQEEFLAELEQSEAFFTEHFRKVGQAFVKAGGNLGKLPARQIADTLISARNALKLPLKFKPWEALKWGKWLKGGGKFVSALGPILDTAETVIKVVGHVMLDKKKTAARDAIKALFTQFNKSMVPGVFEEEYFPAIAEARKIVDAAEGDLMKSRERIEQLVQHERATRAMR